MVRLREEQRTGVRVKLWQQLGSEALPLGVDVGCARWWMPSETPAAANAKEEVASKEFGGKAMRHETSLGTIPSPRVRG